MTNSPSCRRLTPAAALLALALPALAHAGERTYQFRSQEDASTPPDDAVCAAAGFPVNAKLGASVYVQHLRGYSGRIVQPAESRVGRATACLQLTNFAFPPGLQQNFYGVFDLPIGRITVKGTCTLVSNDVPARGFILAGCALKVVDAPARFLGGAMSSLSSFNPFRLPGFATGSQYTLQLYTPEPQAPALPGRGNELPHPQQDGRDDAPARDLGPSLHLSEAAEE